MKVTARMIVSFEIPDTLEDRLEAYGSAAVSPIEAARREVALLSVSHDEGLVVEFTVAVDPVLEEWP